MKASARTWEGEITHIGATGVAISEPSADGWDPLVCIRRVNADVLIAGSSLTVSLQQRGAPFTRRVGYESLTGVGYRPRTGWRSRETLRLGVVAEDRRQLCIDLTLQKTVDAAEVAQSIAQRAARHRLRHAPAGQRDHYARLAAVARLPLPRLNRFAVYQLPAPIVDHRSPPHDVLTVRGYQINGVCLDGVVTASTVDHVRFSVER